MFSSLLLSQSFISVREICIRDLRPYHISMESLRLENTHKVIKSDHHLPSPPLSHAVKCYIMHHLNTSRNEDSTNSQGSLFQYLANISMKQLILTTDLQLPWHDLRFFLTCHLRKRTNTRLVASGSCRKS